MVPPYKGTFISVLIKGMKGVAGRAEFHRIRGDKPRILSCLIRVVVFAVLIMKRVQAPLFDVS